MSTPKCGTYGGYQLHGRRREVPCSDCTEALAAYMRHFRRSLKDDHLTDRPDLHDLTAVGVVLRDLAAGAA